VTSAEALELGADSLPQREGLPDPRREALWLLAAAWGVDEVALRLHPEREVPAEVESRFRGWLARRGEGEPAHHLLGSCPFFGRDFRVSPAVLVPRPESELVVEVALELPVSRTARVIDVGTGSGCLAVTMACERPRWRVAAVDRSPAALEVAADNARTHAVPVALWVGDLATAVGPPWDLVVANLPYLRHEEIARLPLEVRHDPPTALDGGPDGLELVGRLLADLPRLLRPCGGAVLELGVDQSGRVAELASRHGLAVARRVRDAGGVERVVALQPR
jgi:release factor glutamine methyltransferase